MDRRVWLTGATGLVGFGAGIAMGWPAIRGHFFEPAAVPQRLGPRRLLPPLLRAAAGGEERIYALAIRPEQDATDPADEPSRRDRVELLAWRAEDLSPVIERHLVSARRGDLNNAALLGAQQEMAWAWLGGIAALSLADGSLLATPASLSAANPGLDELFDSPRQSWSMGDALMLTRPGLAPQRIDPRDFRLSPGIARPDPPLPPVLAVAPHGAGGPYAFRVLEARRGEHWLGFAPTTTKLQGPIEHRGAGLFLSAAAEPGARHRLWRGRVGRHPMAPRVVPAVGERVEDPVPVEAFPPGPMSAFLTAGTRDALALATLGGWLVMEQATTSLVLLRIEADGSTAWRVALPLGALRSVLPGEGDVVLVGWRGEAQRSAELLVGVSLADGALAQRPVAGGEAG